MLPSAKGISARHREMISHLHRAFSGPFSVGEVAGLWGMERSRLRRLLAHWTAQGWLCRVRRGWYSCVPLAASRPEMRREDPWLVAWRLFGPGYLGGWTACEHWGLTEQVFADIVAFTTRRVRERSQVIQGTRYVLRVIPKQRMFGLRGVWRNDVKVQVSGPSRTVVDILDEPSLGGGIRHVAHVVAEYFAGEHRDEGDLIECIRRLGNRTVAKRLGYILEACSIDAPKVTAFCRDYMSSGYSRLDPQVHARGRFLRRWNLEVNATLDDAGVEG